MKKTKLRVKKSDVRVGRWVRTTWDDIGARDGLIISRDDDDFRIIFTGDFQEQRVQYDQVISVGRFIDATNTGLDG